MPPTGRLSWHRARRPRRGQGHRRGRAPPERRRLRGCDAGRGPDRRRRGAVLDLRDRTGTAATVGHSDDTEILLAARVPRSRLRRSAGRYQRAVAAAPWSSTTGSARWPGRVGLRTGATTSTAATRWHHLHLRLDGHPQGVRCTPTRHCSDTSATSTRFAARPRTTGCSATRRSSGSAASHSACFRDPGGRSTLVCSTSADPGATLDLLEAVARRSRMDSPRASRIWPGTRAFPSATCRRCAAETSTRSWPGGPAPRSRTSPQHVWG